jgi:hypothetical protein
VGLPAARRLGLIAVIQSFVSEKPYVYPSQEGEPEVEYYYVAAKKRKSRMH